MRGIWIYVSYDLEIWTFSWEIWTVFSQVSLTCAALASLTLFWTRFYLVFWIFSFQASWMIYA